MNKMTCGSKDQYVEIAEKRDDDSKKQGSYICYSAEKMRSMHSSVRIEEMMSEIEGY